MSTETVEQVVAEFFGVDVSAITEETGPRNLAGWDSMKHIELIMQIEIIFGKQFAPAEVALLTSVGKIKELIRTS